MQLQITWKIYTAFERWRHGTNVMIAELNYFKKCLIWYKYEFLLYYIFIMVI